MPQKRFFKQVLVVLIFLMILGGHRVLAQTSATVNGTISDQNGAVIQNAVVHLLNLGSNQETNAQSDSTGKYEFSNVSYGSYRLSAVINGFAENAQSITVNSDIITQNFSLAPGAIQDVVTVTAGKGNLRAAVEVPQTVTVATSEQIEQRRPRSTFEAIERTPNLIVRETNPARERPRLRGLDSTRVLILIDGERLNNARTDLQTGLSPSIVDVTELDSAEVVAGAGSSLYGSDSIAGTINLITRGPRRPSDGVNLGVRLDGSHASNGRVNRGAVEVNLSNKMAAFRGSYSQFRNSNYHIGNRGITLGETIALGNFFTSVPIGIPAVPGGFTPTNGAGSYTIFSVPAGGELPNGQAHGFNDQFDMWFYPSEKHNLRARYLNSQHSNLGDAFSGPPYETQERFNTFRSYDKFGLRYEGVDFASWLPRVAVNFYRQKLTFPQDVFEYTNQAATAANPNGSYTGNVFTGLQSRLTLSRFTDNKNTITTNNIDAQATVAPFAGLLVTGGVQDLKDYSRDEFTNYGFINFDFNNPSSVGAQRGASAPNTTYNDRAAFFQADFDRFKYLRITGGLRVDNWRTKASPSAEFPLGNEFAVLQLSLPQLQARPGALAPQVNTIPSLIALAGRTSDIRTNNTSTTGSFGIVGRLPYGINPYFRYGTSYREPSITERYLIRIFAAFPGLVAPVVGNPGLKPETGRSYDVGVKAQGRNYTASFGYFRNDLKNLIVTQTPEFGNICVAPNPSIGLLPLSPIFAGSAGCPIGQSAISFNGRINQANNVYDGFEGTGEYSQSLGRLGSLNPFVSFGSLHGKNESPTALNIYRLQTLEARTNSPIKITGSVDDFPLGNITPFRIFGGLQYNDATGRLFLEYAIRHQNRVTRIDPSSLTGTTLVNYGTYRSLGEITKQDIRGGYVFRRAERYRLSFTAGIQNLTDRLFWEQFQNAPAPGRSYIFGFTTEFYNLLGNK